MADCAIQGKYYRPACFSCDTRRKMTFVWLDDRVDTFLVPWPPPPVWKRIVTGCLPTLKAALKIAVHGTITTAVFKLREVREGNTRKVFYEEIGS